LPVRVRLPAVIESIKSMKIKCAVCPCDVVTIDPDPQLGLDLLVAANNIGWAPVMDYRMNSVVVFCTIEHRDVNLNRFGEVKLKGIKHFN